MRIRLTLSSTLFKRHPFSIERYVRIYRKAVASNVWRLIAYYQCRTFSLIMFVVPSLSSIIVSKQQWSPFKFFWPFALLLSGGTRGGGPLASEWHSLIGTLSTRLFHNVNEKVTPIFGAARGVHVFRYLYNSTDSGGVCQRIVYFIWESLSRRSRKQANCAGYHIRRTQTHTNVAVSATVGVVNTLGV